MADPMLQGIRVGVLVSGLCIYLAAFPLLAQNAPTNDYEACTYYATTQSQQYFAFYSYSENEKEVITKELFDNCMRSHGHEAAAAPYLTGDKLQSFLDGSL